MPEFVVMWHQEAPENVDSWEFQVSTYDPGVGIQWDWVLGVSVVDDCATCYSATVMLPEDALFVRSRSISPDGLASEWSESLAVPEPAIWLGLVIGALGVGFLKWFNR